MRVHIEFDGEPYDRLAVLHTLRHLAMRLGWTLTTQNAERRVVYVTLSDANRELSKPTVRDDDLVIVSHRGVGEFLRESTEPIPLTEGADGKRLPFVTPAWDEVICARGRVRGDVVAGAWAVMNLWYESRQQFAVSDGWIRADQDWWYGAGFSEARAFADEWLDEIACAAKRLGWQTDTARRLLDAPFIVILTHDVDYMPGAHDYGLPRLLRALGRQLWLRQRPKDAGQLLTGYASRWRTQPYATIERICAQECQHDARSSFQFVVGGDSRYDPTYRLTQTNNATTVARLAESEWEVGLHGGYTASRTQGQLTREKAELEQITRTSVLGHRQHYLNFHPPQLWRQVEAGGFAYDSSVGYNDATGARAGTYYPYRPYAIDAHRAHEFWEIPFVLMDTTLATTFRDAPREALARAQRALEPVIAAGGCAALIWHAEQSSGLVDPGFDEVYEKLLEWLRAEGGALVPARAVLAELDARWQSTWADKP